MRPTIASFSAIIGVLLGFFACLAPADAAQINYGTHMGDDVVYVNVSEDSGPSPLPLFGAPTVTGNSIDFSPLGFDATSSGVGSQITDSNLSFMIVAKPGHRIEEVFFSEAGDTTQAGNVAPGSMGTSTAVFASGVLDIQEVDFVGIDHISVPFAMTFTPSGGTYFLGTDGGGGSIFHTIWTGSLTISVADILVANGYAPSQGATKVTLDLDNTLVAVSESGTSAFIAKKDFGGITTTTRGEVPEPAAAVLLALGVAPAFAPRRRRH
jgi:hypothetical protein